jgi:hypothetical protein
MSLLAVPASVLIKAAIAGSWRSFARQRTRLATMFSTGMPSLALILAYGTGGSWVSMVISCWQREGRCVTFRQHQFLFRHRGLFIRDVRGVQHLPKILRPSRGAQDPAAFPLGGGGQPARKSGRVADGRKLARDLQPEGLAGVEGAGAAQVVPLADCPDERAVPVGERVPRRLVAVSGLRHQAGGRRASG